jgi:oligosaccharide repeat unit polymerase
MLLAVNFSVTDMVHFFMTPRFTQPWGRGKFGDWKALVGELGMTLYLVPPVAGIVFATRKQYTGGQKAYVALTFLFTLFYGFTSGTRNIFVTYLATFLVAYAFSIDPRRKRELVTVGTVVAALTLYATVTMLQFRNMGFENYLAGYREEKAEKTESNFFVDYNLYVVAKLVDVFPAQHDYLGLEIPYLSIIRPIPRALWHGKPEGLSLSIEDAVGVEGLTLASSFVGEAYMSGGMLGVLITGLFFGSVNGWWNRFGRADNSAFGHLVFASGFFAAVISMRSMFVFTTAILPTFAALVLGNWLVGKRQARHMAVDHPTGE